MNVIYQPKGRAREYSPLALNVYTTCAHACDYCYCKRLRGEGFVESLPSPRKGIVSALKRQLEREGAPKSQVMLSFMGDPFGPSTDDNRATIECLEVLADAKVPVAVLTKAGTECLKAYDTFERFGGHIMVGQSLTFSSRSDSEAYEPGAAVPEDRIEALRVLHGRGIKTFASFEPVIDPGQSLELIEKTLDVVDIYKVGKINNYHGLDKTIDWDSFLASALDIIRSSGNRVYVKEDLRRAAPNVPLRGNEVLADDFAVR